MGNKLESMIRKAARALEDRQLAMIWKVPEEMQQTPCDFFGFTSQGRAILIEAKMVNRPRLPVGKSPGLLPHQWHALRSAHRAGALSFIIWMMGDLFSIIQYHEAEAWMGNGKSIKADRLYRIHQSYFEAAVLTLFAHRIGHRTDSWLLQHVAAATLESHQDSK